MVRIFILAAILIGLAAPCYAASEEIETLQWRLLFLGYDVVTVDGEVGPETRAAIRAFERDQGLRETGEPSETVLRRTEEEWQRRRDAEWEVLHGED